MSEEAQSNPLYDAAVGFMVAEKSGTNAWEQVATFVQHYVERNVGNPHLLRDLKTQFTVVERQVKKDFMVTALPGAWKSAKSHAINAVARDIPLFNEKGEVMPKTDVGKLLRAAEAGLPVTPLEKFKYHMDAACAILLTLTGKDRDEADRLLEGLAPVIAVSS